MSELTFRNLLPHEIQCRAQTVKKNGWVVLLYKDARCDMNILDQKVGTLGWKKDYQLINNSLFCTVYIYNGDEWVSKQDVGSESMSEAEKGQASDAFKRACFNWGIGRELYTSPFIWINAKEGEVTEKSVGNKKKYYLSFKVKLQVKYINVVDGVIEGLEIADQDGSTRYKFGHLKDTLTPKSPRWEKAVHAVASGESDIEQVKKLVNISDKDAEKLVAEALEFKNSQS